MTPKLTLLLLLLVTMPGHSVAREPAPVGRERFVLNHTMEYEYDRPVTLAPHVVRLVPQAWTAGTVHDHELLVKFPGKYHAGRQLDLEGNLVAAVTFEGETKTVTFQNSLTIEIPTRNAPLDLRPEPRVTAFPFQYTPEESKRLAPYLEVSADPGPRLAKFSHDLPRNHASCVTWLADLARRIEKDVKYFTRGEEGVLDPEVTLDKGGSCRDLAWVMIQVLRRKGIAARFVSGYQIPPWAIGQAAKKVHTADLHAWVEVYLPGCGWIALDPTAGTWAGAAYVPLAVAAHPRQAGPLQGTFGVAKPMPGVFAKSTLRFTVTVQSLGAGK